MRLPRILVVAYLAFVSLGASWSQCNRPQLNWEGHSAKYDGKNLGFRLGNLVEFKLEDKALQTMHESVQLLNTRIRAVFELYNNCVITQDDLNRRLDELLGFSQSTNRLEAELSRIERLEGQRATLTSRQLDILKRCYEDLMTAFSRFREEQERFHKSQRTLEEAPNVTVEEVQKLIEPYDKLAGELGRRVGDLESRVQELEYRVAYLMNRASSGELAEPALLIGAHGFYSLVESDGQWGGGAFSEMLIPKSRFAARMELCYMHWMVNKTYETLPGVESREYTERNLLFLLNACGLLRFRLARHVFVVGGLLGSITYELPDDESDGLTSVGFGALASLEWTVGNLRMAIDTRLLVLNVSETTIDFDPFGPAILREEKPWHLVLNIGVQTAMAITRRRAHER